MPLTTLLIPEVMQMITFAPSGDYVSTATHTTTPASPRESAGPVRVGHHSVRRWCDFIYAKAAGITSGENKVLLLDCSKNAPKLLISLLKEGHYILSS